MKIVGLDIGTTGCKCTVFDEQGIYLDKAYRDYPVKRAVGGHEVDVSVIMEGVYACIHEMAKKYPDIAGIGVTSFGETFVCVDEAAGIDMGLMAKPVPTGTVAGTVSLAAVQKTGLGRDTKVVSVSHDQVSAAVGAGAFDGSVAVDGAGTVECLTPVYDQIPDINVMYQGYFSVVPYVIPGKYVAYAFSYTGGALMQWCTETLAKKEMELAKEQGISVNEYLEQAYASQKEEEIPSGLLVLPHFAGTSGFRNPVWKNPRHRRWSPF
ncbi:MAG: FGGY family carbohydrate kinase [Eubacteriales bacterium]|nr:FGGY family carbohydrate kinase [Eubacteriales bacterium]